MKIREIFDRKTVFSFEVFPPKKTSPIETIYSTLEQLRDLRPDFISVTFGAGGSGNSVYALDIASNLLSDGITPMLHLPCINFTKQEIADTLARAKGSGVENVLALRGDINPDIPLFFDNAFFYEFRDKAAQKGINVPIEAGIMPVVNKNQIERMVTTCGASLPGKFVKIMQRYEHNPEALRDAGIAYAINQIVDLAASGVDGIHLYTMNNPYVARKICEAVTGILGV